MSFMAPAANPRVITSTMLNWASVASSNCHSEERSDACPEPLVLRHLVLDGPSTGPKDGGRSRRRNLITSSRSVTGV